MLLPETYCNEMSSIRSALDTRERGAVCGVAKKNRQTGKRSIIDGVLMRLCFKDCSNHEESECVTNMEYLHGNPTELDLEEKSLHPPTVFLNKSMCMDETCIG